MRRWRACSKLRRAGLVQQEMARSNTSFTNKKSSSQRKKKSLSTKPQARVEDSRILLWVRRVPISPSAVHERSLEACRHWHTGG